MSEVVIHKALPTASVPEDEDINNFNEIAEDRMNESMLSNEPEVSEKVKHRQSSDEEEEE